MVYKFNDVEDMVITMLHGHNTGLEAEINHRFIKPHKLPNTSQHVIVFYVSLHRLTHLQKMGKVAFGDNDFTKSLSRYITAGMHYMDDSEDIQLVEECAGRRRFYEREIIRLEEEWEPLNDKTVQLKTNHTTLKKRLKKETIELEKIRLDSDILVRKAYSAEKRLQSILAFYPLRVPTKRLLKTLWLRLISKLGLRRTLQK